MKIKYFLLLSLIFTIPAYSNEISGKVIKVIDGNTIEILDEDNETVKIMLTGVDCPELGQEHADVARNFTEKMILKKNVTIKITGRDIWGNKLAIITLKNGKVLNHELVKEGLAWTNRNADNSLVNLQEEARNSKLGLWVSTEPTPPWIYRQQQSMLTPKSR